MIHAILAFLASHLIHVLIGGGITAALGGSVYLMGWPLFLKYWKEIVGLIALLAIAALVFGVLLRLKTVEANYAQSVANFTILKNQADIVNQDNANLVAQLKAQDDSITQAAQAALLTQASLKLSLAAAQASQAQHKAVVAKLQARSQVNEGTCDDEINFLRAGK